MGSPSHLFGRIRDVLRHRPDSEHEMMANRLAFAGLVILYMVVGSAFGGAHARDMLRETYLYFAIYLFASLLIFCHILYRPGVCVPRRLVAIVHDLGMISYAAQAGGELTGFFYPLYLWTIFGNGFRFGVLYVYAAMGVALVGFVGVLMVTGFGLLHPGISLALLVGLVLLPLYVSVLIRKLSEAKRQAEAASRAKSLFLASVSHELRTPLNAILGLSDLLQEQVIGREQAHMVRTIGASGRSLLTLINSVLDLSRIEAGRMPSRVVAFDVYETIGQVRDILAVHAQAKGLRLCMHVTPRTPRLVRGTHRHLEEVLMNLVGNALKFTTSGHVVIAADAVRHSGETVRVRFEVSDTGIGIAEEAQGRIFESFTQADETIIDQFGGTGLGLAICKQLVELQGGEIGVISAPGQGSTFWFEIDMKVQADHGSAAPALPPAAFLISSSTELQERLQGLGLAVIRYDTEREAAEQAPARADTTREHAVVVIDEQALGDNATELQWTSAIRLGRPAALILVNCSESREEASRALRHVYASVVRAPVDEPDLVSALQVAAVSGGGPAESNAAGAAISQERKSLSILVAEDNRTNQMVITKILERGGHAVEIADDGEAALRALTCGHYDVVLMDVNMPVMNGIEATRRYRLASAGRERVPVIALTADVTEETRDRCAQAGMDACATKPIEPKHLLDIIDAVVSKHPVRSPAADEAMAQGGANPVADIRNPLDHNKLNDLERLAGREFVDELIAQFISDASHALRALSRSAAEHDAQAFRAHAHALRSCAGNLGAQGLFELCLSWREITSQDLAQYGSRFGERLAAEFDAFQKELAVYRAA